MMNDEEMSPFGHFLNARGEALTIGILIIPAILQILVRTFSCKSFPDVL